MSCTWVESVRWRCRWLPPALFFKDSEHGIQQHLLCSPFKQALAKVGQDGEVKAGISQV